MTASDAGSYISLLQSQRPSTFVEQDNVQTSDLGLLTKRNIQGSDASMYVINAPYTMQQTITMTTTSSTVLVRVPIPQVDHLLLGPGKQFLSFNIVTSSTGGSFSRISQGAWTLFQVVNVYMGGTQVEKTENFGLLASIIQNAVQDAETTAGLSQILQGNVADTTARAAISSGSGTVIYLDLGAVLGTLFGTNGVYPAKYLPLLEIELQLALPQACLEIDGTVPGYVMSNLQFLWQFAKSPSLDAYWAGRKWIQLVNSFDQRVFSSTPAVSQTVPVPSSYNNALGIVSVLQSNANTFTTIGKFNTFSSNNQPSNINLTINNINLYQLPLANIGQLWFQGILPLFGPQAQTSPYWATGVTPSSTTHMVVGIGFSSQLNGANARGINTKTASNSLFQVQINFAGTLTNLQWVGWTAYLKTIEVINQQVFVNV